MESWSATALTAAMAPVLSLDAWLSSLAQSATPLVLLGGTGHLDLSGPEEASTARQLETSVLPALTAAAPDAEFLILTGLAPGADLLFAEVVPAWLTRHGRRHRHAGLLAVPVEVLWGDWLVRDGARGAAHIARVREQFERNLAGCSELVQLWDSPAPDWSELAMRQAQYRRLAAVLAEQCEVLVAIMRPGHAGQPGGSAEVIAWRQHSAAVPSELSSGARRHARAWRHEERLIVLDPSAPQGPRFEAPPWERHAREALRAGEYLQCYDIVAGAEAQGQASGELSYLKLLALANAGSTRTALRLLGEMPAALRESGEDWLALEGRLEKDLGLQGGAGAAGHFRRASGRYQAAFRKTGGYFSAINAATTALMAGDAPTARALAEDVLAQVARFEPRDEQDHYYLRATEAEAALLLGDEVRARAALQRADRLLADDVNARSRTLKQLRRVCAAIGLPAQVLESLALPPVVYAPAGAAATMLPHRGATSALAFAGITEPRELECAEQLVRRGLRLHAVLAAPREKMLDHWRRAHGSDWTLRLGRLLEQVRETSVAQGFLDSEDRWCDAYVAAMALGLSRLTAARLGCRWRALDADGRLADLPDAAALMPQATAVPEGDGSGGLQRRFAGIIFADFAGFSRLSDDDLPAFWAHFMQAISERLADHRDEILLRHTWGDALHVVTAGARAAADIACEIQDCLEQLRPALSGGLARLELRLSAHYAPVFAGIDPVEGAATFFGTQLSFTARIEPVTPPGMIFVTEAFAAQIALEAPDDFGLEYAGEVGLAKAYGKSRLFSLRRAHRKTEPPPG